MSTTQAAAARESAVGTGTETMPPRPPLALGVVGALAAVKLGMHLAANAFTPYGVHRDELLYLAMGRHLELWKMEFPPFIAVAAEVQRGLFGDSLLSIRLFAALAGTLLVVLAALVAREVGGGRFAQGAAALAVLCGVLFQRSASLFQPVVFDQLWWTLAVYALLRLRRTGDPRGWLAVGAACGAGLFTKFSILFFGAALFGAILLTRHRRALATPWPWAAAALALAIGSPSLVGQARLGFPMMSSMSDLRETQLAHVGYLDFLLGQVLMVGPAFALAAAGAASLLAGRAKAFRLAGWACVLAVLILMLLHGKPYYAGPVYPALLGAGAAALEAVRGRAGGVLRWCAVGAVAAVGVLLLPMGVPALAPERMVAYTRALGLEEEANRNNRGEMERLPQDYADMLGWPEQVAEIARVYHALPPEKRAKAVVWGGNYGEAGAIDFFGPRHGLPGARSDAGTYWFFGPGPLSGEVLITIGTPEEDLRPLFRTVTRAGYVDHPWAVSEERDNPIYVAENPTTTLQALWPSLRGND